MNYNTLSPEQTLSVDLELDEPSVAWIAGLLEGECTFGNDKRNSQKFKNATPPTPWLKLRMSDKDIVDRFAEFVNKNVTKLPPVGKGGKLPIYSCYVGDRGTMFYILNKILPYMGERRSEIIKLQLQYINDWVVWCKNDGRSRSKKIQLIASENELISETETTGGINVMDDQDLE